MYMYVCICMCACMYMCVYAYMYMFVCIIYWGGIVRGEMSYPKREGNCPGGIVLGETVRGELSRGKCCTPCMYIYVCACIYVYMHVCIYVCMCAYMYVYIYISSWVLSGTGELSWLGGGLSGGNCPGEIVQGGNVRAPAGR